MLPWKLRKCQILPVNQNLSSVYFSLAKFQLVRCNPSLAMIWQMTCTHKLPKLCSATLKQPDEWRVYWGPWAKTFLKDIRQPEVRPSHYIYEANAFVLRSFFSLIKTIWPRVSTKPLPNDALPVDVRCSKTLLLKLPNDNLFVNDLF